jgi:hypothetical protein
MDWNLDTQQRPLCTTASRKCTILLYVTIVKGISPEHEIFSIASGMKKLISSINCKKCSDTAEAVIELGSLTTYAGSRNLSSEEKDMVLQGKFKASSFSPDIISTPMWPK